MSATGHNDPPPKPSAQKGRLTAKGNEIKKNIRKVKRDASRIKFELDALLAVPFLAIFAWSKMENRALDGFALLGVLFLTISHHTYIFGFRRTSLSFRYLAIFMIYGISFYLIRDFLSRFEIGWMWDTHYP